MLITHILQAQKPTVSFEFFPPKDDDVAEKLYQTVRDLQPLLPSFITVTCGAGGSTRQRTQNLVIRLNKEIDITAIPHLTCVGVSRTEIADTIQEFVDNGVENILALRGDPPKEAGPFTPHPEGFRYANELVGFIKQEFPTMGIGVAGYPEGHPETPDLLTDIENLKRKVDAGADVIISQLFFDNRDFYDFVSRCEIEGITVPIIAGIMPIQSIQGARRMTAMCGARIPAPLLRSLKRASANPAEADTAVKRVGTHWATEQCRDLIDHNVHGIHLYTLNKSIATRRIYENLGIHNTDVLHAE